MRHGHLRDRCSRCGRLCLDAVDHAFPIEMGEILLACFMAARLHLEGGGHLAKPFSPQHHHHADRHMEVASTLSAQDYCQTALLAAAGA